MGGKQKQAQRTKGNTQASSSSRAAELLEASGAGVQGFMGFGALSGDLGYVPATVQTGSDEATADPDFHMALRKLSKKDPTTKLKALQEFSQLCQEKDVEAVKSVLPFWPRVYSKTYMEPDRRVREATGQSLEQLVIRVKRDLAPYLKTLIGPWLVAQCDPYQPAASAARSAFLAAFPPAKQAQAFSYCKSEAFKYLQDNLTSQTAATLSDPKVTEAEEMESKYERVVSSSLLAVHLLLTSLPADQLPAMTGLSKSLLTDNKLWKLAKHKSPLIRSSFYALITAYCLTMPEVASEFADKFCPLVLHNLSETEPLICPKLWEAVLCTVKVIENCWEKVNMQKGVLPGLWTLLSSGGNGCAAVVFPNLLPLLSKLPAANIDIYIEFFTRIRTGMKDEKVQISTGELDACVLAHMECLRYCLTKCLTAAPDHRKLQKYLIYNQLMSLIETSLLHDRTNLSDSPLYSQTVELLAFLQKLCISSNTSEEKKLLAKHLLDEIWSNLLNLCTSIAKLEGSDASRSLPRLASFFTSFLISQSTDTRDKSADSGNSVLLIDSYLLDLVSQLIQTAKEKAALPTSSSPHLQFFASFMSHFLNNELLDKLMPPENNVNMDTGQKTELLFNNYILPLLRTETSDTACTELLVTVFKAFFAFVSTDMKLWVLPQIYKEVSQAVFLEKLTHMVLSENKEAAVIGWYRGSEFGELLHNATKHLCDLYLRFKPAQTTDGLTDVSWALFKIALSSTCQHGAIIGNSHIDAMTQEMQMALSHVVTSKDTSHQQVATCVEFVCDVAKLFLTNMPQCVAITSTEELLFVLFQLSAQYNSSVPESCLQKARETWPLGVTALVKQEGGFLREQGFLCKAANHLKFKVHNSADTMSRLGRCQSLAVDLVRTIQAAAPTSVTSANAVTTELLNMLTMPFMHEMTTQWWVAPALEGMLSFNREPSRKAGDTPATTVPKCVAPAAFTSHIYATLSDEIPDLTVNIDIIMENLYSIAFCRAVLGKRKSWLQGSELGQVTLELEKDLSKLLKSLVSTTELLLQFVGKSAEHGHLWSLGLGVLLEHSTEGHLPSLLQVNERLNFLDEGTVHLLQVASQYLHCSDVDMTMEILAAQILSCGEESITLLQGGRGFLSVLCSLLRSQEGEPGDMSSILSVLEQLMSWRQSQEDVFAFDRDISSLEWEMLMLNVEVMRMLGLVVVKLPTKLTAEQWDFIMCGTASWIQSVHESWKSVKTSLGCQLQVVESLRLLASIAHCMKTILPSHVTAFPPSLLTEWTEFFSEAAFKLLLPLFIQYTGEEALTNLSNTSDSLLRSMGQSVALCPAEHIFSHTLPANLIADQHTHLPHHLQTLLNHFTPLLLAPNRATQLAAYHLLQSVMPSLPEHDIGKENDNEDEDELSIGLPAAVEAVLEASWLAVEDLFVGLKMGEFILLEPHTVEHTSAMAYLLAWRLSLTFFRSAPSELKAKYAQHLKENGLLDQLLRHIFHIMPEVPMIHLKESLVSHPATQKLTSTLHLFSEHPLLKITGESSVSEVQHLACSVYYVTLQELPAAVRQWWNEQDKPTSSFVEKFTSKYCSPMLSAGELSSLHSKTFDSESLQIKVRQTAREVFASYTIQEFSMELLITLPLNHPLGPLMVESGKRLGVSNTQWRNWMLQMTTFLNHQNGSIYDGVMLWKKNIDKHFEGVDDCMVCFSVIHNSNYQLPRLQCKICKKKFHSACLYKWFSTSNNSTCPLCRSLF